MILMFAKQASNYKAMFSASWGSSFREKLFSIFGFYDHFEKFPESRQDFKLFLWLIRRKHPVSTRILHLPLNWFHAVDKPNT